MKSKKSRNREFRTKPGVMDHPRTVRIILDRSAFDQMKMLERGRLYTKEEIFLAGLQLCSDR